MFGPKCQSGSSQIDPSQRGTIQLLWMYFSKVPVRLPWSTFKDRVWVPIHLTCGHCFSWSLLVLNLIYQAAGKSKSQRKPGVQATSWESNKRSPVILVTELVKFPHPIHPLVAAQDWQALPQWDITDFSENIQSLRWARVAGYETNHPSI